MKKYTLEQKMTVCGYCLNHKESNNFMGMAGDYCLLHKQLIVDKEECHVWDSFWESPKKAPLAALAAFKGLYFLDFFLIDLFATFSQPVGNV